MSVVVDGLYQVTWKGVCAGFVIESGKVTLCAPILKRHPWMAAKYKVRVGDVR